MIVMVRDALVMIEIQIIPNLSFVTDVPNTAGLELRFLGDQECKSCPSLFQKLKTDKKRLDNVID
jgi:hypothetical protein